MSLIELKNISFRYNAQEPLILKDFSLSIDAGEFVVVEGDNGSGKTTVFRILNALSFPESGAYFFDGNEINVKAMKNNRFSKLFHKRIGYLFQNPDTMLFNARVFDEIAFGPRQMGLSDEMVNERVKDCLKLFELEGLENKAPYHLSGGQKKRVALASVMALNPDVLILDEPYAGLDKPSRDMLSGFLAELKTSGKTIITATHNIELLSGMVDQKLKL